MCEGPHVEHTGEIPQDAFKLDSIAGAYWQGAEKNQMLTRIYGLAFATKAGAGEPTSTCAKRRWSATTGSSARELDLFHIEEEIGKGLPLWLPNGTVLRDELEKLAKESEFRDGYERVATPHIARQELFYRSRPPALLQGEHVPADGARGEGRGRQGHRERDLLPEADELPASTT